MGEENFKYEEFEDFNNASDEEKFLITRKVVIDTFEDPNLAVDELFIKAIVDFKCGDYEDSLATLEIIGDIIQRFENLVWSMLEIKNFDLLGNAFPFLRRSQDN